MKPTTYLLLLLMLIMGSCSALKKNKKDDVANITKEIIIDNEFSPDQTRLNYTIENVSVDGDIVTFDLSYTGGCKSHSFHLYARRLFAKSKPPQITVFLEHKNSGDRCKEIVTEKVSFNIKKIRYEGENKVIVRTYEKQSSFIYGY